MSETTSVADDMMRSYFERWQRLEEEKRTVADDLKELFAEAKGNGFDAKVMRAVFRAEVGDQAELSEFEALCDLYRASLRKPRAHPARSAHVENITQFPSNSQPVSPPQATAKADTVASPAVSATPFKLRPHCQHPANCAGYGSNHCHSCKVALASSEVA